MERYIGMERIGHTSCVLAQRPSTGVMSISYGEPATDYEAAVAFVNTGNVVALPAT
jgi:hypothetical protein